MRKFFAPAAAAAAVALALAAAPTPTFAGERGSGGGQQEQRVEGLVTAVNAAGGTVTIGATVVKVGPGTKIERNGVRVPLSAFKVGDRGQARITNGVATKVEAVGP